MGKPALLETAASVAQIPRMAPTEISICPVRMTHNMPIEAMARYDMLTRMFAKFSGVKKRGAKIARTMPSTTRNAAMESSRLRLTYMAHLYLEPGGGAHDLFGGGSARKFRGDPSLMHHQNAVGHAQHLWHIRRYQQDTQPLLNESVH